MPRSPVQDELDSEVAVFWYVIRPGPSIQSLYRLVPTYTSWPPRTYQLISLVLHFFATAAGAASAPRATTPGASRPASPTVIPSILRTRITNSYLEVDCIGRKLTGFHR